MFALKVNAKRGPSRQRGIEEVDGKVARNSAVRKPATLRDLVGRIDPGKIDCVERDRAQQERKTETHADRDDDGQVR